MRHFVIDQPFILAQATAPAGATTSTGTAPEGAAPGGPAGAAQQQNPLMSLVGPILIFAAFWFLLIAPQRKRQKELEKTISELKIGDSVITTGGIFGRIESVRDDRFVIKISDNGTKIEVAKGHISGRAEAKTA